MGQKVMNAAGATVESLRIGDPRQYGQETPKPDLTTKATKLAGRLTTRDFLELQGLVQEHLTNGEDEALTGALAACPDERSYGMLFGAIALSACQWTHMDQEFGLDAHWLFGIQLTMHPEDWESAMSWVTKDWGPNNNAESLSELRQILQRTGATAGIRNVTVVPHLVDQARILGLDFSKLQALAVDVVERPQHAASMAELEHKPWSGGGEAQARVLVLAGRCDSMPQGLVDDNATCANDLIRWSKRWFGASSGVVSIASSPELLLSLITGKGQQMVNCARLAALLETPSEVAGSPVLDVTPVSAGACQGKLEFRMGKVSCTWDLHGRNEWEELRQSMSFMLPQGAMGTRYARVQFGLGGGFDAA